MLLDAPAPTSDPYLTITQIITLLPFTGRNADRVSPGTVARWILHGIKTVNGERVRLVGTRFCSRWMVKRSDLEAFLEAQRPRFPAADEPVPRSPAAAERAAEKAGRLLEEAGV
jgi:hypothetical protein